MAHILTCPHCQARVRLSDDLAGAEVACPRCNKTIDAAPSTESEEVTTAQPAAKRRYEGTVELITQEVEENAPPRKRGGFVACPRCGAEDPKRVLWTFWGSFYGTAMLNHVRCQDCNYTYNGRTGGSNMIWAAVFVTIPALLIACLLAFIAWVVITRMF